MANRDLLFGVPRRVYQYKAEILDAAQKHGVDPLIVASIIEQESAGGDSRHLDKLGPGGRGDGGHGHGLMQIDDRSHRKWLASHDWADPAVNIMYGAEVLSQSIRYCGDIEAGIAGYNCGPSRALEQLQRVSPSTTPQQKRKIVEWYTHRREYVTQVMRRVERWRESANKYYSEKQGNDG